MHSSRTLNTIPSVLLLQFTWSLAQASDSIQSLHAPRDRRRFRVPRQHTEHFCTGLEALCSMFASTNSSSFKISSECLTPPVSAAFNRSARSPFVPDTAVLIFHDQFYHWSSPPRALRCYRIPSCSTAVAVTTVGAMSSAAMWSGCVLGPGGGVVVPTRSRSPASAHVDCGECQKKEECRSVERCVNPLLLDCALWHMST